MDDKSYSINRFLEEDKGPKAIISTAQSDSRPFLAQRSSSSSDESTASGCFSKGTTVTLATTVDPEPEEPEELFFGPQHLETSEPSVVEENPVVGTEMAIDYYLPCTFSDAVGCGVVYGSNDKEVWIRHNTSHFFKVGPPAKCVCIFCDDFESAEVDDRHQNWRNRMLHIAAHYAEGISFDQTRPDYFVLEHLEKYGAMTQDDYQEAIRYSERPFVDGLVDLNVESPAQLRERREMQIQARVHHDLGKEKRMMQKLAKNKEKARLRKRT